MLKFALFSVCKFGLFWCLFSNCFIKSACGYIALTLKQLYLTLLFATPNRCEDLTMPCYTIPFSIQDSAISRQLYLILHILFQQSPLFMLYFDRSIYDI